MGTLILRGINRVERTIKMEIPVKIGAKNINKLNLSLYGKFSFFISHVMLIHINSCTFCLVLEFSSAIECIIPLNIITSA
jgi:hypothetical protein